MNILAAILATILIGAIAGYVACGVGKAIDQYFICEQQEKHNARLNR